MDVTVNGSFLDLFHIMLRRFYRTFVEKRNPVSSLPLDSPLQPRREEIGVKRYSLEHVLKNFAKIRFLEIELPKGEFEIEDSVLLKWRADGGSTVDNCMLLVASSIMTLSNSNSIPVENSLDSSASGTIPDFNLRVVLTILSYITAMSRRYFLLQTVIKGHKSLDSLILSDANGQGVLTMNREQLEEFRATPFTAWVLPSLNMRMWYAPQLDLPDGTVLKGVTLVAARPAESKKEVCDPSLLSDAFEEPFRTAAKMLIKRTSINILV